MMIQRGSSTSHFVVAGGSPYWPVRGLFLDWIHRERWMGLAHLLWILGSHWSCLCSLVGAWVLPYGVGLVPARA